MRKQGEGMRWEKITASTYVDDRLRGRHEGGAPGGWPWALGG